MSDYNNFFNEELDKQKEIMTQLHTTDQLSVLEIAKLIETYPNKIFRWGVKAEFTFRNKGEAQKNAFTTGKKIHPTQGKTRTDEEKKKISRRLVQYWTDIPEDELERRKKISQENWANMDEEQKKLMQKEAAKGRIEASKSGSKLEKIVLDIIVEQGLTAIFHREHALLNDKMHLDIVVPELKTAIEIDGPTHFLPIWGEEELKKTQKADNNKDGLLLNSGYNIVRIRQTRNLSKRLIEKISKALFEILEQIRNKETNNRYIIGEDL